MSEKALRKRQQHPRQVTRITEEQARAAVQRFANRHFNNPSEKSRASIPAAPDDDDILLMDYITQREAALAAVPEQAKVCEKQWHMYVWTVMPRWIAVAQAENVDHARALMLEEIGTSHDGSCPEREAADKWVRENNPAIFHFRNAEFALTDSAELREQEDYANNLQKQLDELKKAAPAPAAEAGTFDARAQLQKADG